jgi:hypothetical protein
MPSVSTAQTLGLPATGPPNSALVVDPATGGLNWLFALMVAIGAGAAAPRRPILRLNAGGTITLAIADDAALNSTDVTISDAAIPPAPAARRAASLQARTTRS